MTPWKSVLLLIIGKIVTEKSPDFTRSELIKQDNQDAAVWFLHRFFSYKENPQKIEQTMQKVLQGLRDDGCVKFFNPTNSGQYQLTKTGFAELHKIRKEWAFEENT